MRARARGEPAHQVAGRRARRRAGACGAARRRWHGRRAVGGLRLAAVAARAEASRIRADAEAEAARIVDAAKAEAARITADAAAR